MKRLSALWANNKSLDAIIIDGDEDVLISSISLSSKNCTQNSLFVAHLGLHTDGHIYIKDAIENGAVAIVHSSELEEKISGITYIKSNSPRMVASLLAHSLYAPYPPFIIGVTGTDGKSTTCEFLHSFLSSTNATCGLLSTLSIDDGTGKRVSPYRMSTPDVDILYPFLHECYKNGVEYVILESTSHGLSEKTGRLSHITFSGAIISNISSEHLDFHGSLDSYIDDKMNLIRSLTPSAPIVIQDSFNYRYIVSSLVKDSRQVITYAVESPSTEAYIKAKTLSVSLDVRTLLIEKGEEKVTFPFSYAPSIFTNNLTSALTLAHILTKKPLEFLLDTLSTSEKIPGRFEIIYNKNNKIIINDFAHTKSGFLNIFAFIKMTYPFHRIVALFGAAGERDVSKRGDLGNIASIFCNIIYLTDEDSRGEKVQDIIRDIRSGFSVGKHPRVYEIYDRKEAIHRAIRELKENDILLLLGKGHEKSIDHGTTCEIWDETQIAQEYIRMYM